MIIIDNRLVKLPEEREKFAKNFIDALEKGWIPDDLVHEIQLALVTCGINGMLKTK